MVQSPRGQEWVFRFYDPRILFKFCATCLPEEIRRLFGPIFGYGICDFGVRELTLLWVKPANFQKAELREGLREWSGFRLRPEQLAIFQAEAEQDFVNRLAWHLKENHARAIEGLDDQVLEERIRAGLKRARRYEISEEATLASFVGLMFEFAPNFDEHPRMQAILMDRRIPPDDRIHELVEEATDSDWDDVRHLSDLRAWSMSHEAQ